MVAHRAFALIEAIVATIVLAIALTVVLGLTARAISSQTQGEHMETAARLADECLNLVLACGPEGYGAAFPLSGTCDDPFQQYAYEVNVAPPGGGGEPYRVRATITWRAGALSQSLTLETLIAPRLGDEPDPDRKPTETTDRNAK